MITLPCGCVPLVERCQTAAKLWAEVEHAADAAFSATPLEGPAMDRAEAQRLADYADHMRENWKTLHREG